MADKKAPAIVPPPPLPKVSVNLYFTYIASSLLLWILAVAGIATAVYETKSSYTDDRGWSTSLWKSCMKDTGTCKTIVESELPCASLGHLLRTARGFNVLAVLVIAAQFIVSVLGFLHNGVKPYISRTVLIGFTLAAFILLLIGAGCAAALYSLPQCTDHADRMAAANVSFVQVGPCPVILFTVAALQLALGIVTMTLFRGEEEDDDAAKKYKKDAGLVEDKSAKKKPAPVVEKKADAAAPPKPVEKDAPPAPSAAPAALAAPPSKDVAPGPRLKEEKKEAK